MTGGMIMIIPLTFGLKKKNVIIRIKSIFSKTIWTFW